MIDYSGGDGISTIKDVAAAAGVSVATVSRVLNDDQKVSAATRERVMQSIGVLGWSPSMLGRSLRRNSTQRILVLLPTISHAFFSGVVKGAEAAARCEGYQIVISVTHSQVEIEREYIQMLYNRSVDGILMLGSKLEADEITALADAYPVVLCSEMIEGADVCYVGIDDRQAAYDAVDYLCRLGHRRIGLIANEGVYSGRLRRQGYLDALRNHGITPSDAFITGADYSFSSGDFACRRLMRLTPPPTAVFAVSDVMAAGVLRRLYEMGLQAGRDVSLVGFDNINLAKMLTPKLTTVSQSKYTLGRTAMDLLLERILNPVPEERPERRHITVNHKLVVRESSGKPLQA